MDSDEGSQIAHEARQALSGAEGVRARLLAGLSFYRYGGRGFLDGAYFIKTRVKKLDHLVDKVLQKRAEGKVGGNGEPYSVADVTDVLGLRILVLWRDELAAMVREVVRFINFAQGEPFAMFDGSRLSEAIAEVIIYQSPGDVLVSKQVADAILNDSGLGPLFQLSSSTSSKKVVPGIVPITIEEKDSHYSSIHIVSWCREHTRIPLEIQIRHPLEDYWSEVEWLTRYKKRLSLVDSEPLSVAQQEQAWVWLREIKTLLDSCSRQSQSINRLVYAPKISAVPEQATSALPEVGVEPGLLKSIQVASEKLREVLTELQVGSAAGDVQKLEELSGDFAALLDTYMASTPTDSAARDVRLHLAMQRAQCLYWRSFLIKSSYDQAAAPGVQVQAELFDDALNIYLELAREDAYRRDARIAYAIGTIFVARGNLDCARGKYSEALKILESPDAIDRDDIIRLQVPRMLAITLWKQGKVVEQTAGRIGDETFMLDERRHLYLEALRLTAQLHEDEKERKSQNRNYIGVHLGGHSWDRGDVPIDERRIATLNDLLTYVVDYLSSNGSVEEVNVATGMSSPDFIKIIDEIAPGGIDMAERPAVADTVRAAAKYFKVDSLNAAAASRVLQLLNGDPKWVMRYGKDGVEYMRREAQKDLESQALVIA